MAHAPVGMFSPNPFGLHDVIGNVKEWCLDAASSYDRDPRRGTGLRADQVDRWRTMRGGSFAESTARARSAHRKFHLADRKHRRIGVRAARLVSD